MTNGIDIDTTRVPAIADLNVTDPKDLFYDNNNDEYPDIINKLNKLNDINAMSLATDLNKTLQRRDEIIRHLEESE